MNIFRSCVRCICMWMSIVLQFSVLAGHKSHWNFFVGFIPLWVCLRSVCQFLQFLLKCIKATMHHRTQYLRATEPPPKDDSKVYSTAFLNPAPLLIPCFLTILSDSSQKFCFATRWESKKILIQPAMRAEKLSWENIPRNKWKWTWNLKQVKVFVVFQFQTFRCQSKRVGSCRAEIRFLSGGNLIIESNIFKLAWQNFSFLVCLLAKCEKRRAFTRFPH